MTAVAIDEHGDLNAEVWARGQFVELYASRELRPGEALLLDRYGDRLGGRVLELGCGAGRMTGHLRDLARELQALDISPAMVEYCRRAYPEVRSSVGDIRDLSSFDSASLEAVVAPFNVVDVLGDGERRRVLREIRRVLVGGGLLIFSSHNLAYAHAIAAPTHVATRSVRVLLHNLRHMPRRVRNRRRLAPLERSERDYALLVDEAHDFSLLHYYISRDAQERQLADEGFELLECVTLSGEAVPAGESAGGCPELYYAASATRPSG